MTARSDGQSAAEVNNSEAEASEAVPRPRNRTAVPRDPVPGQLDLLDAIQELK